jgi:hypothetical protein
MSNQRFKNELRGNENEPDFDLDSYLLEQSEPSQENEGKATKTTKSSFLKNAALILSLSVFALLYFNNWSPKQVVGNIFGIDQFQSQTVAPVSPIQPVTPLITNGGANDVVVLNESDLNGAVIDLSDLEGLAKLEGLEGLEGLQTLEQLAKLEALEGLAGLENLAKLSALEALSELNGVQVIESDNAFSEVPGTLESYTDQLSEAGLSSSFNSETVKELYEAGVPVSVLKSLNDNDLLESVGISSLIEGYKNKDN